MNFLVNDLNNGIEQHLIRLLFREECFGELLAEPGELAKKRQRAQESYNVLKVRLAEYLHYSLDPEPAIIVYAFPIV